MAGQAPSAHEEFNSMLLVLGLHHSQHLVVKNTFLEVGEDGGNCAASTSSKANSDPTSKSSSRNSSASSRRCASPPSWPPPGGLSTSARQRTRSPNVAAEAAKSESKERQHKKKKKSKKEKEDNEGRSGNRVEEKEDATKQSAPKHADMLSKAIGDPNHWSRKLPSIGTVHHMFKTCTPCVHFVRRAPCPQGRECLSCHSKEHLKVAL